MATAAVIEFGSFPSLPGAGQVQAGLGSGIELDEFVDSGASRCSMEFDGIVGSSPALRGLLHQVRIVAPTDATVLIGGETGTGKELIARAIHMHSDRRHRPFIKVNCASIPAELLESELFGHEKGAFTGAIAQRIGRFEAAHSGTLFLDEIGEMPLHLQTKLLRVLQEQEFERVGGSRTIQVDVRIVAATNRDLKTLMEENRFRADLYYRLAVFPLNVPSLRERREDIPLLTRYFVQKHARRMDRNIESIPTYALEALTNYDWPGNIRELQNVVERSVVLSDGPELYVALPELDGRPAPVAPNVRGSNVTDISERARILQVLKETKGMVGGANGAAARFGLRRTTLQSRMRRYNIARNRCLERRANAVENRLSRLHRQRDRHLPIGLGAEPHGPHSPPDSSFHPAALSSYAGKRPFLRHS